VNKPLSQIATPHAVDDAYRAAFEDSPMALAIARPAHPRPRLIRVNPAFSELVGTPAPGVEHPLIDEVFRATAGVQIRRTVDQCLKGGPPVSLRVTHTVNDEVVRLDVQVRPLESLDGPSALIAVTTLVHRLPLAELGEASLLAEMGPLSRGLIYFRDLQTGQMRVSHHPLRRKLGMMGDVIDANRGGLYIHPDDLKIYARFLSDQRQLSDGDVARATFRMKGQDGSWVWVNFRSRVFARAQDGTILKVIGNATDVTDSYTKAEALAEAATALAHAEINERRRIGLELHDSTSQLLVAAQLNLGMLAKRTTLAAKVAPLLEGARSAIREAQREIRAFAFLLHPPSLESETLDESLRSFANGFAQRTGLTISVRLAPPIAGKLMPLAARLALMRIAQEALMNVYRHAQARKAWVRLLRTADSMTLEIEDDGVGLPQAEAEAHAGVGISGMRARMTQLNGTLELVKGSAGGLLVRARLPADLRPPT
jgi:signal transduction histidine kinase